MTAMLRSIAFAIAMAAAVDPAITLSGASRARVAVVAAQPPSSAADAVRDRLVRDLSATYEIVPQLTSDAAAAVVIGDRYPGGGVGSLGGDVGADLRVRPAGLPIATVTMPDLKGGARIVRVDAPSEVTPATAIHLGVEVEGTGVSGRTSDVTVTIAGVEAGRATHRWTANTERWRASIDAVPVGDAPYVAQVRLKPDTTETTETSTVSGFSRTAVDIVVDLRRSPIRVEFYDPRPSWATTFLRRALEGDARFQVASLSVTSRGISTQTGGAVALGDPRLDAFDAVIVGGLDRLSAADARSLDRYLRERGGAVIVVPDQRIDAGPAHDFVSGGSGRVRLEPDLVERLLEQPAKLVVTPPAATLQASELLVLRAGISADVIARVPGGDPSSASGSSRAPSRDDAAPVIVTLPRGDGRLLISGAMDAWRFRAADNGAFDRFWQSTVAGLALAVPPPIAVEVVPPLLQPGESVEVVVRVRARDNVAVKASVDAQPIRLSPDPEPGVYRGRFTAKTTAGRSIVEVRAPGPIGSGLQIRTVLVQPGVQRVRSMTSPSLAMLASSHRGIDVDPAHLADVVRFLGTAVAAPRASRARHPMRSAWWIVPFAACLSAEWWLRRRRGLR